MKTKMKSKSKVNSRLRSKNSIRMRTR